MSAHRADPHILVSHTGNLPRPPELEALGTGARDQNERAMRGISADRVRLHTCWGSGHRPHKNEVPLGDFMDVILRANVACVAFEASNPPHNWEWEIFTAAEGARIASDQLCGR